MENEKNIEIKKPIKWKKWFIMFLLILILGLTGYIYYWYDNILQLQKQAEISIKKSSSVIQEANLYKNLKESIQNEYNRCQEFISQKEGDFGSFEYCKRYIEWTSKKNLR